MLVSLAAEIETRDGTMVKDSQMLNCFWEPDAEGGKTVVKRPGFAVNGPQGTAGAAQGVVSWAATYDFIITNDTMQPAVLSGSSFVLPGVTVANQRITALDANVTASGTNLAVFKSITSMWVFTSLIPGPVRVNDADYPAATVPGIAYLDGTYYVMTEGGVIYGSDLEAPASWNSLNTINTDRGLGKGVALHRHLNYVAAFCDRGVQFFYDAGNAAPGSPLGPTGNALSTIGCASADSIATSSEELFFMSKSKQKGRSISKLSGLTVAPVSTPFVDKILNRSDLSSVYSYCIKTAGHSFYILTLVDLDLTLAYDITTGTWTRWSSYSSGADHLFRGAYYLASRGIALDILLDRTTGAVYAVDPGTYTDDGVQITTLVRTRNMDHGTLDRKQLASLRLIGDTVNTTVSVRYSDDDYGTWSAYRSLDMNTVRKELHRFGSFRRRAFDFLHTGNTALRLKGLEFPTRASPGEDTGA